MPKKRKEAYLNPIGQRLNEIISHFRIDIKKFAKKIYYSPSHLSDVMNGKKRLTERMIKNIVSATGAREHWLLTGEGEKFDSKVSAIAEKMPLYGLPERLQELIDKLKVVYHEGFLDEKIKVKGAIDAVFDEIKDRKEAQKQSDNNPFPKEKENIDRPA